MCRASCDGKLRRVAIHIREKRLDACFPPSDPLSCLVFRLAVLKEDLTIEFYGQRVESIDEMDRGDPLARKLYFTKRSFVTLFAMREVLQDAGSRVQDAIALASTTEEKAIAQSLTTLRTTLNRAFEAVKDYRHQVAAHLDPEVFGRVLEEHGALWGEMQVGSRYGGNYWRLAQKASLAALLPPGTASTETAMSAEALRVAELMTDLMKAVMPAIDDLVFTFLVKNGEWR